MTEPAPSVSRLEADVRDVLSGTREQIARATQQNALLLACTGFTAESDRIADCWASHDDQPLPEADRNAFAHRAWEMLFAARGCRPGWANALVPLDLDAHERAQRKRIQADKWATTLGEVPDAESEFGGLDLLRYGLAQARSGSAGSALEALERFISVESDRDDSPNTTNLNLSTTLAAELAAKSGDTTKADALLVEWARQATARTSWLDLYQLAACRNVATRLVKGVLAESLGIDNAYARHVEEAIRTALDARFTDGRSRRHDKLSWAELIEAIRSGRAGRDLPPVPPAPLPATETAILECERRLGSTLPTDYREFLRTADGLPEDNAYPKIFGTDEIRLLRDLADRGSLELIESQLPAGWVDRAIRISPITDLGVLLLIRPESPNEGWQAVELDWLLGSTVHPGFRDVLGEHLALLDRIS